jgi:hypothetical protein
MARADAAKGGIAIWGDTRLATRLAFVYRREREHDPSIRAIRDVVLDVFAPRGKRPARRVQDDAAG